MIKSQLAQNGTFAFAGAAWKICWWHSTRGKSVDDKRVLVALCDMLRTSGGYKQMFIRLICSSTLSEIARMQRFSHPIQHFFPLLFMYLKGRWEKREISCHEFNKFSSLIPFRISLCMWCLPLAMLLY